MEVTQRNGSNVDGDEPLTTPETDGKKPDRPNQEEEFATTTDDTDGEEDETNTTESGKSSSFHFEDAAWTSTINNL